VGVFIGTPYIASKQKVCNNRNHISTFFSSAG